MQKIRDFVHQFDMFAASPTLRAHCESQITNFCGGLFSLIVLGAFMYIFIDMNIRTIGYQEIQANQRIINQPDANLTENVTLFSISFELFRAVDIAPFLGISVLKLRFNNTEITDIQTYDTAPCTDNQWKGLGDKFEAYDKVYDFSSMLCLKEGQTIELKNEQANGIYDLLIIDIEPCNIYNGTKYQGCAPDQLVNEYVEFVVSQYLYFTAYVYFIDTAFDATAQNPIIPIITRTRSTFTTKRGSEIILPLNHYTIQTDESLLPYQQINTTQGWYIGNRDQSSFEIIPNFRYVRLMIYLGGESKVIERVVGKLDEILSYVGGLFGIIISFFGFFMFSFNEYRYELMIGENAFNYDSDGKKFREEQFHFLYYLKYSLYDWVNTLFCCKIGQWGRCKEIHETRQQVNEQLDVKYLFKRLQHFERALQYLMIPEQKIALYLTEPPSMQEVRRNRKMSQYYDKIIQGKSALTLQDIELIQNVLNLGIKLTQQENPLGRWNKQSSIARINETKKNKQGFPQQMDKSRQNILNVALENFENQAKLTEMTDNIHEEDQDKQIEEEIAQALFGMKKHLRAKIQEKIPLKVLNRLKTIYNKNHYQERLMINLDI